MEEYYCFRASGALLIAHVRISKTFEFYYVIIGILILNYFKNCDFKSWNKHYYYSASNIFKQTEIRVC